MPLYTYKAVSKLGRNQSGYVEADSFEMAKEKLRAQKLLVTLLKDFQRPAKEIKLKPSIVLTLTHDLAQLLKAGLPLYDSLLMIEEKYRGTQGHLVILDLCDQVKHGMQLSSALKRYQKSFDGVYIAMVAAGERSGSLAEIFEELAVLIQKASKLKKQITTALIYPAFIGSFCLIVVSVLLFFLVPSMAQLFEGHRLHPMTAAVLGLSNWLQNWAVLLGSVIACIGCGLACFWKKPRLVQWRARMGLHTPIVKDFITQAVMVRFCRTLGRLMESGVPLLEGLNLAKSVMQHPVFEQAITKSAERVVEGSGLSEELKKQRCFPKQVTRMLAIAEESGSSSEMLGHIAECYSNDLEKNLMRLTAYLQPVILLVLGLIVGVILLAVLLPLTDVSSFLE
ncbi:MAG: type II secretion system F family protein [Chlamydiia bacterium]|nr:type II secretion system F family protein [Chlamydiia bacterium]